MTLTRHPLRRLAMWNPTMKQVIVISVLAVTMACAASIASAIALHRIGPQVTRIDDLTATLSKASAENFETRRSASLNTCNQREDLKTDLRLVLRKFGISTSQLPVRNGRVVLSPLPGGCMAYVKQTVPTSIKP